MIWLILKCEWGDMNTFVGGWRVCEHYYISLNAENCSYQRKNQVNEDERFIKACEAGMDYGKCIQLCINSCLWLSYLRCTIY